MYIIKYYVAYKYHKMYVCMIMCFPLPCPGPGYWLLSRRVVPPPQSDHGKQLLSGESTHPIRHKKGHHIIHVYDNTYKGTFMYST